MLPDKLLIASFPNINHLRAVHVHQPFIDTKKNPRVILDIESVYYLPLLGAVRARHACTTRSMKLLPLPLHLQQYSITISTCVRLDEMSTVKEGHLDPANTQLVLNQSTSTLSSPQFIL